LDAGKYARKEEKSMKVVMPRGRENETLDVKFDVMPYGGCACSKVDDEWLTVSARFQGGPGKPCQCQCAFGTVNKSQNFTLGNNGSEW